MSAAGVTTLTPVQEDLALSSVHFGGLRSPHCSTESIRVYLAVPGSSVIPMQISESDSIASVKLRIQNLRGFVMKQQKLVFDGRELARNNSLVRDYGVTDGNVLHLFIRLSDIRCITVRTICGKQYEFRVENCRNIGYIKQQLAKRGKDLCDLDEDKLIFDGEELNDKQLINDICKNNDAVIHLLIRKSAKFRTRQVQKDFELSIDAPSATEKKEVDTCQALTRNLLNKSSWVQPVVVNPKVDLSPAILELIQSASAGLEKGNLPVMSVEGSGGAYFMQDSLAHRYVGVFKPIDEEPMAENNPRGLPLSTDGEGLKRGTRVGEGALREVAAYILDHPMGGRRLSDEAGFAGVPPTVMVRCLNGDVKNPKIGSLQAFIKNNGSCEDIGPGSFPVEEVHKISLLDMRLANADRHAGNILIHKDDEGRIMLVPIDHGYCLPENLEDCTFEWLYWPQSRQPFSEEVIDYIKLLDAEEDIALLKFYGWELSLECSSILRVSTMLLKKGVERGLTPYDIGNIMCRETVKKESKLEEIMQEATDAVLPGSSENAFLETVSEIMDRRLDELFA